MTDIRALIIDDEPDIRELLMLTLLRMGIDCDTAENVGSALDLIQSKPYNLCLTDMRLPDGNGMDIVHFIQENQPTLPVAMITAHGNMDLAIEAMKAGAFDFINKPIDIKVLRAIVESAVSTNKISAKQSDKTENIVGNSPAVKKLNQSIAKLSRSQAPVYISGESGSGKELVARSIHNLGPRSEQPFVPVNCGAIPSELVESEFFGYVKGAFTGATRDSEGLFQAANGGTLFLDEVADLPLSMQVKILRAIQEKAIRPVGTQTEIPVDVRILSATHKDLSQLVDQGDFRQDLFYRINVIQLDVPPLKERADDIPALVAHILKRLDANFGTGTAASISQSAIEKLKRYSFPGNIRELENILERAFTLCDDERIDENDLQLSELSSNHASTPSGKVGHFKNCLNYPSVDEYLAEIEKEILTDVLESERWNKTNAAKTLGITFRSFRYRLQKLGLNDEDE